MAKKFGDQPTEFDRLRRGRKKKLPEEVLAQEKEKYGARDKCRMNEDGLLEFLDDDGNVMFVEKAPKNPMAMKYRKGSKMNPGKVVRTFDSEGKLVYITQGMNPDKLGNPSAYQYCQTLTDIVLMKVTEGMTIKEICKIEGIPPIHVIYRWTREHPEFKKQLEIARKDRASTFHDAAIEIAMGVETKTEALTAKVKIDTLKWAAEKGSPSEFGSKTVHEGNPDQPITFLIDTGIRRKVIEVKSDGNDTKTDNNNSDAAANPGVGGDTAESCIVADHHKISDD